MQISKFRKCMQGLIHQSRSRRFQGPIFKRSAAYKISSQSEVETVVIGGGMGGLMSAAYLAKNGFPVTLIEQHSKLGGYVGSFERLEKKYRFEQSIHITYYDGFATLLEEIGISLDSLHYTKINDLHRIISKREGKEYDIVIPATTEDEICQVLAKPFPHEVDNIRKICKLANQLCKEIMHLFFGKKSKIPLKLLFPFKYPLLMKYGNKTLKEALAPITKNDDLLDVLFAFCNICSLDVSDGISCVIPLCVLSYGITNRLHGMRDTSQRMANAFGEVIRENGGKILLGQRVKEINVKDNRVQGVTLTSDLCLPAKAVISNLNPISTFQHLLTHKSEADNKYLDQLLKKEISLSCFSVYLGLKKDISDILPECENILVLEG